MKDENKFYRHLDSPYIMGTIGFTTWDNLDHINSPDCWCEPELEYVDPESGSEVWVHREIH